MKRPDHSLQRITALTPLSEVIARLESLAAPVAVESVVPCKAVGATFATDLLAPIDLPGRACALHDGWAVQADLMSDASPYAPVTMDATPLWMNAGNTISGDADSVLPPDAVTLLNGKAEVTISSSPGEGVVPAGFHFAKDTLLRKAGDRVRPIDSVLSRALQIEQFSIRAPRVKILSLSKVARDADYIAPFIAAAVQAAGAVPEMIGETTLASLTSFTTRTDAVITIGGTGRGDNDHAVRSLAGLGTLDFHGLAIAPGETAALGRLDQGPVLMLPGRFDAAVAAFFLVGRLLLQRLALSREERGPQFPLTRKVASNIGFTEMVLVRRAGQGIEPLGSRIFSLNAIMQADGWIVVPAESEGFASGTRVEMRSL